MRQISRGLTMLAGDARTIEYRHWGKWLGKVPAIRRRFITWSEDFDPLRYNEAASVAALANAASSAGYLALTEYIAQSAMAPEVDRFAMDGAICGLPT